MYLLLKNNIICTRYGELGLSLLCIKDSTVGGSQKASRKLSKVFYNFTFRVSFVQYSTEYKTK